MFRRSQTAATSRQFYGVEGSLDGCCEVSEAEGWRDGGERGIDSAARLVVGGNSKRQDPNPK